MKDFLKKLKKAFGAEPGEAQGSFPEKIPVTDQAVKPEPNGPKPVKDSGLPPAHRKREEVIRFIIHSLHPYINEKNTGIKGIRLFIRCNNREEENLVNIALYADRQNAFKEEVLVRKLSDNYIYPEPGWHFEFILMRDLLPECMVSEGSMGLDVIKHSRVTGNFYNAKITVLSGQAEKDEYLLDPSKKLRYTIGRGKNPALPSGVIHTNDVVFISKEEPGFDDTKGKANMTVSRYHAMIVFNAQQKKYYLAADKGGTPDSGNKTKLFSENGRMTRLDIPGTLHELTDGDQFELGGSAKLLFRISGEDNVVI